MLIALVVLLVLGGGGGYAAYFYYSFQSALQNEDVETDTKSEADEDPSFNVLLVGSDSREGLTEREQLEFGAEEVGGERADTLIVARINPDTDHVTMVQFPRDLYVKVPGGGRSKINETLDDGDTFLINTVKKLTGIEIHHYAKVNIAGFRDLVDAIGGVEVCVPEPIPFDPQTGIEIPEEETGMVEFDGERALRFVRTRNFETGDFERIRNQQRFLAAAIDKITSVETLLDPDRIFDIRDIAKDNVEIDSETTVSELYRILQRLRSFDPEDYEAYTAPNYGVSSVDLGDGVEASIVEANYPGIQFMFDVMEEGESPAEADGVPDLNPSNIDVAVYNGTKEDDAADEAADDLAEQTRTEKGAIDIEVVADAGKQNHEETLVVYGGKGDKAVERAEFVAAAIEGAEIEKGQTAPGIDVSVVVGEEFETQQVIQIIPIPIPEPSELPPECQ